MIRRGPVRTHLNLPASSGTPGAFCNLRHLFLSPSLSLSLSLSLFISLPLSVSKGREAWDCRACDLSSAPPLPSLSSLLLHWRPFLLSQGHLWAFCLSPFKAYNHVYSVGRPSLAYPPVLFCSLLPACLLPIQAPT